MDKIAAGIVTYQPNLSRLKENLDAICSQVERVIIVDNGSDNISALEATLISYNNVQLIPLEKNYGIAKALNTIFESAENQFDWVLTLDQDSVVCSDIISEYTKYSNDYFSFTCLMNDRNAPNKECEYNSKLEIVNNCITSGNMVRVSAWKEIGGFNEMLFIDMVDIEFCYRLRSHGYPIYRVNKVLLLHELGRATSHHFLWKRVTVYNHSAMRKYHIIRNTLYLIRKYPRESHQDMIFKDMLEIFIFTILYEKDKIKKIRAMISGAIDSYKLS